MIPDVAAWPVFSVAPGDRPPFDWAAGLSLRLPPGPGRNGGSLGPALAIELAPGPRDLDALRMARGWITRQPASSRLPFNYHRVPVAARMAVARLLGHSRRRGLAHPDFFPSWPLDLSADILADLLTPAANPFRSGPTPVLVSHDIDSPEGLSLLEQRFLDLEEKHGARSANYLVPCKWPLDHGMLAAVQARGHELGVHGYDHGNRTPFCTPVERHHRLAAARPLIERYEMRGYRAPSLVRTPELLADLAGLYQYDSSIPSSGGLFPTPGNGCASARPFRLGGLLEIPLSLPRDGSLQFLGHAPGQILALWRECTELISRSGGVVVLLTHCERHFSGHDAMLGVYEEYLAWVAAQPHLRFSSTAEVCARVAPES